MATVSVQNLRKVFPGEGRDVVALEDVSFEASGHTFVSIVGPSGCGKSTLLNILAGVETPTGGTADITKDGSRARVGYVFQAPRLLPWRSVMDNMLFVQPEQTDDVRKRAARYLEMVGLSEQHKAWPAQLSGGMQQRVGIARAFSIEPDALLMDEPFSHLDAITARGLRRELHSMWMETKKTVLFVTHDVGEAVELSDRIVILEKGGKLRKDQALDLPFPRDPADDKVALTKAEVLREFEELDLIAT
ncbi:MAG TPA: ABC transporter ATP-binding protein [Actinomycetota bacterium]|nr:ABC transporter ATP-binding protein [Actinomycetota bacterium]